MNEIATGKSRMGIGRALSRVEDFLASFSGSLIIVIAVAICFDIVARYLRNPVYGIFESIQLLMAMIVFLGLSLCQRERRHIAISILFDRFRGNLREIVEIVILVLGLGIFLAMTVFATKDAVFSFQINDYTMGVIAYPKWPSKFVIPVGTMLISLRLLNQLIEQVTGLTRHSQR